MLKGLCTFCLQIIAKEDVVAAIIVFMDFDT